MTSSYTTLIDVPDVNVPYCEFFETSKPKFEQNLDRIFAMSGLRKKKFDRMIQYDITGLKVLIFAGADEAEIAFFSKIGDGIVEVIDLVRSDIPEFLSLFGIIKADLSKRTVNRDESVAMQLSVTRNKQFLPNALVRYIIQKF